MTSHPPGRLLLAIGLALASGGCGLIGGPRNTANIELRKENQALREQVAELERQAEADAAAIRSHESTVGTLPTLPRDRLGKLFTTHDIKLGRLTGGADLDPERPGHEGLKVYVTPVDGDGDQLKAAGAFTVEAFDLARGEGAKVGTWTFDVDAARRQWSSVLNRYNYVLTCPWETPPPSGNLHVTVTFVDELTRGTFRKSLDVTAEVPAAPADEASSAPTGPAPAGRDSREGPGR
jgi:hypothetical protein